MMVGYRRNKPGNPRDIFFLTFVTKDRQPWITSFNAFKIVLSEMKRLSELLKYKNKAWVILPDHIHWLIVPGVNDYSNIVSAFKRGIGAELKRRGQISTGYKLWQDRFWEETIRDDTQFQKCVEYIHYNPVKHGLVVTPGEWKYSSFHAYVRKGLYPEYWASSENIEIRGSEFD